MKETKVYVDELPKSCKECPYSELTYAYDDEVRTCKFQFGYIALYNDKFPNCPLQSLQIHDRELARQVCEKIRKELDGDYNQYRINYILDQIQKEFEK